MAITIRTIADGELLSEYEVQYPEYSFGELRAATSDARRTYPGRTNVVVQLIERDRIEAENYVNPAPALS